MTTAVHHHHNDHRGAPDPSMKEKEKAEIIPEFIEDRRKDSEGRITINRFSIGKLLGKGGFAKCYQGMHMISNQQYALKIIAKSTLVKPKSKQKLQTEIRIHRALRHTFVCKFERYFEDNNNVYMLLELCSNNSMSELLKKRKKLTEPEVRYYISQLISSLKYLHHNLVIHRDLKLGNLFLDSQMRIKVGDFGLATKISDVNERRKTFCGTPNYIAPEILQGKEGHSFEVDVWSTGVIIYTLLVGKPPFDSKDIKTTYEKILANSFAFPDSQHSICEHSKNLIRSILQTKPSARPKLDAILEHPFYTKSGAFTPTQLPESAMREPPSFSIQRFSGDAFDDKKVQLGFEVQYGDENDPRDINRIRAPSIVPRQKGYILESKDTFVRPRPTTASGTQSGLEMLSRQSRDVGDSGILTTRLTACTAPPPVSGTVTVLPGVLTKGVFSATPNCFSLLSAPPQKKERLTTTPAPVDRHSYSSKFDIYQDSKAHLLERAQVEANPVPVPIPPNKQNSLASSKITHHVIYPVEKPREVMIHSSKGVGAHRTYEHGGNGRGVITSSSSAAVPKPDVASEIDILQSELEWFRLGSASSGQTSSGTLYPRFQPSTCTAAALRHKALTTPTSASRTTADAWCEDDHNVLKHFAAPPPIIIPAYCSPPQVTNDRANLGHLQPCTDSEPMNLSPPSDQILVTNEYKALGTLETMHEVLASKGLDDLPLQGQGFEAGPCPRVFDRPQLHSHHKANIWVVRYVDYTSKYGLGFLLNTGSAGVYFNDSTKIVVSPDGTVFQYSERRRKEKGSTSSEHSIQTHSVNRYPAELQKKVTLLRHFRNYLVDQQKEGASRGDDGSAAGGREDLENIAITALEGASSGASASIPFGASSTILRANDAMQMGCCFPPLGSMGIDSEPKMPFLKKWVRTRHAILFRLSNRTVQVLFFDRSEVLLSSEARMVTYVSKQNIRSEHSLEEVLQTGRTDIAKRLKYAKDIMYRLISTQAS